MPLRPRHPRFIMVKPGYLYILATGRNGTLYTGVTSDLVKRVWQHRSDLLRGFTQEYGVHRLVYFEVHEEIRAAILREKRVKKWRSDWKLRLIESTNPKWLDLFEQLSATNQANSRGMGE